MFCEVGKKNIADSFISYFDSLNWDSEWSEKFFTRGRNWAKFV
jgi:hypothetical protein